MTEVLQPLNERVAETVVKNADLLESHAMEPLLLQLIAHVSAYRVIIKRCGLLPPRPFAAPLPRPPFASSSAPRTIHSATQVLCSLRSAWLMYIHPAQIPNLRCCCQTSVKNCSQYHVRSCLQHRVFECIARKFRLQAEQGRGNSSGQPPPHCVSVDVRGIMAMARLLPRLDAVVLQPVCCVALVFLLFLARSQAHHASRRKNSCDQMTPPTASALYGRNPSPPPLLSPCVLGSIKWIHGGCTFLWPCSRSPASAHQPTW